VPLLFPNLGIESDEGVPEDAENPQDILDGLEEDKLKVDYGAPDAPFNIYFEEVGYKYKYLIANLGSTFLYLMLVILILVAIPVFGFIGRIFPLCKRIDIYLREKILWNGIIRFIL
jgi:hypothetical protein